MPVFVQDAWGIENEELRIESEEMGDLSCDIELSYSVTPFS